MRLTTRGWTLLATAAGLYLGSRALGAVELSMLAAGGLVTTVLGALIALLGHPRVKVSRTIRPARLYAGTVAHAEIELVNTGKRVTPVLAVVDRFTGRREARFAVPPLLADETARGGYRIPTDRRGVYEVGPLQIAVTDPLGLVRRVVVTQPVERVTVFPRVEPVASLPLTVGRDLVGGAVADFTSSRAGDEFHSLREYNVGDDLRRVHWPSTARTGQLMIREHDVPWQTRATLLVDNRAGVHSTASFERTIEAAASIATALHQRRSIVRLLTPTGLGVGFGTGHDHYLAMMERLAVIELSNAGRLDALAGRLHRQAGSGALIAFTGAVSAANLEQLATLGRRFGFVAVTRVTASMSRRPGRPVPGITLVDVGAGMSFATAWSEALLARFGTHRALHLPNAPR